jgi:hypothetical protein
VKPITKGGGESIRLEKPRSPRREETRETPPQGLPVRYGEEFIKRWDSNRIAEDLQTDDDSRCGALFELLDFELHDFLNVIQIFHDRLLK